MNRRTANGCRSTVSAPAHREPATARAALSLAELDRVVGGFAFGAMGIVAGRGGCYAHASDGDDDDGGFGGRHGGAVDSSDDGAEAGHGADQWDHDDDEDDDDVGFSGGDYDDDASVDDDDDARDDWEHTSDAAFGGGDDGSLSVEQSDHVSFEITDGGSFSYHQRDEVSFDDDDGGASAREQTDEVLFGGGDDGADDWELSDGAAFGDGADGAADDAADDDGFAWDHGDDDRTGELAFGGDDDADDEAGAAWDHADEGAIDYADDAVAQADAPAAEPQPAHDPTEYIPWELTLEGQQALYVPPPMAMQPTFELTPLPPPPVVMPVYNPGFDEMRARDQLLLNISMGSPLALDLDGNGVDVVSLADSHAQFDMDLDGQADHTGWIGGGDGFLVHDVNGNGHIDDRSELFGDTGGDAHGFEHLAHLDSNGDGRMNADDAAWNELGVWRDANGDGVSDPGEVVSLQDADVEVIDLHATEVNEAVGDQWISHRSEFVDTNGQASRIDDVWFQYEGTSSPAR